MAYSNSSWGYGSDMSSADYYREMERQRYQQERMRAIDYEAQRVMAAQQQMAYIPPPDAVLKANADDRFTSNKKLLLLEN